MAHKALPTTHKGYATMATINPQVQAVQAFANTKAGQAAASSNNGRGGMAAVVRAAVAAGKVPGLPASMATNKGVCKALGRQVRQVPRNAGMGVGHGGVYGVTRQPAQGGSNAAQVLQAAAKANAAAAKAQAQAAKAAAAK